VALRFRKPEPARDVERARNFRDLLFNVKVAGETFVDTEPQSLAFRGRQIRNQARVMAQKEQ
jgi:hypothetical protein